MHWRTFIGVIALTGLLLPAGGSVSMASQTDRSVLERVEFEAGSATLTNASLAELRKVRQELERDPDLVIVIEGHTSASGSEENDLALARDRAQAVFDWLVANGGDAERIQVVGYGSSRPRTANAADRDNDRLEIAKIRDLHPDAVVPETEFQFPAVVDGTAVVHDFTVFNRGKGPLKIHRVKTG